MFTRRVFGVGFSWHHLQLDAIDQAEMVIRIRYVLDDTDISRRHNDDQFAVTQDILPETFLFFFNILNHLHIQRHMAVFHKHNFIDFNDPEVGDNEGMKKMVDQFNEKMMYLVSRCENPKIALNVCINDVINEYISRQALLANLPHPAASPTTPQSR